MTTLTVLYGVPTDPDAFDDYYRSVHAPLVRDLPGLQGLTATEVVGAADGSPPPYRLVVTLTFADKDAFDAAMSSPEGQAAGADVPNFASGGATLLIGEEFA